MFQKAYLALKDGTCFTGYGFGAEGFGEGEVVFNTSMSGYQEILSDPSYRRQMLTFTYPEIGNVGANDEDVESDRVHATGVIVRHLSPAWSNYRAKYSFQDYLSKNGVGGIGGIDTRSLVIKLREQGVTLGVIGVGKSKDETIDRAKAVSDPNELDLVQEVTTKVAYTWSEGCWSIKDNGYRKYKPEDLKSLPHVVAIDCGIKRNILRLLTDNGFRVTVVPASITKSEVDALKPDGLFLSNGPGDPAANKGIISLTKEYLGKLPIFGICLGNQILGLAVGGTTYKLKFGHRGGNHPVRDEVTKKVEITVQNHGFAVDPASVKKGDIEVSHINLNDGTVEGIASRDAKFFSVQYHPEASPGPHDSRYLFERFRSLIS